MSNDERTTTSRFPFSAIVWALGIYVLVQIFPLLSPILLSFLLVVLLSLAVNPVVRALRGWFGGRTVATLLVLTIFLVIAGLTAWAFYAPVKKSTAKIYQRLPEYWERIQRPLLKLEQKAAVSEQRVKKEVTSEVIREEVAKTNETPPVPEPSSTAPEHSPPKQGIAHSGLGQVLGGVTNAFKTVAANAATLLMVCITVFVGVIFTLLNPKPLFAFFYSLIPARHHAKALIIFTRIAQMVPRWALATLLGMSIIGVMVFLVMWPILGFQDAMVLGVIALVLEAVPYVGPLLAVFPAVLLAVGKGGLTPLWVIMGYAAIQSVENNLVAPLIVAGRLKLHPVAAIFSILFCVAAFGVLGVVLAVPMVAIVNILHEELYRPRFLPNVSDDDLAVLAQATLNEKPPVQKRKIFQRFRRKTYVHSRNGK